ncbi:MAG TPA: MFS transporter [Gaiellaceae bacterium]
MTPGGAYREILAIRDARLLIGASAASQLGDWLFNAALLGTVYAATGSARWVGAATICRLLPYVVLGPVGGMIADRYDRRTVLLAGDVTRCLLMVALAGVVQTDGPVALILALTALASSAGTAERPAAMALLPRLVGEARLGPANALLHTAQDLGVVVGPAIGAMLLATAPNAVAFLVNGVTFAVSASLVSGLRRRVAPVSAREGESAGLQFLQGLRTARATPFVVPLLIVIAMVELTYGAQTVQLVVYAAHRLDLGAAGYGYLLTAAGVGGLLSAAVNPRLATSTHVSSIVVVSGALYCATQLAYAGVAELVFALLVTLIGGAGFVACEVVAETALARIAPADALGRLMGVVEAMSVAAMVAGALVAPVLLAWTSLRGSLVILGLATVLITALCLAWLRGLDALSRQRADALASRVAVVERLPLVAGAPQLVIEQLASASQICPLPDGVDVVAQGAPAHAFYAVVDGGVLVHRDGTEVVRLGPGDHFGERGLLDHAPRNATVTTAEPSTLLRLEGDTLLDALQSVPALRSALDRSNAPVMASAPGPHTALVDDPAWGEA